MINLIVFGALAVLLGACCAIYWVATRDTGGRAAPRERRHILPTARACLRRLHLPRRAAQARTWAQHAIRHRIQRLTTRPAAIPPAGNPDPDRARHAHLRALRQLDGRPWEYETGEWPKIMLDGE